MTEGRMQSNSGSASTFFPLSEKETRRKKLNARLDRSHRLLSSFMRLVLFTPPTTLPNEHAALHSLAARAKGSSAFALPAALHVRKPGADEASVGDYLEGLPRALLERAVLHSHHALASKFGIQVGMRGWERRGRKRVERRLDRGRGKGVRGGGHRLNWLEEEKLTLSPRPSLPPFLPQTQRQGVHFTEAARNALGGRPQRPEETKEGGALLRGRVLTVSTSLHSCAEVEAEAAAAAAAQRESPDPASAASRSFDYVFLSPIFESISKPGYGGEREGTGASAQFWRGGDGGDGEGSSPSRPSPALAAALLSARESPRRLGVVALGGIEPSRLRLVSGLGFEAAAVLGAVWGSEDPVQAWEKVVEAAAAAADAASSSAAAAAS